MIIIIIIKKNFCQLYLYFYFTGVEERLHNLESHLRLTPGGPVPRDIYTRLRAVEDRVLYLEGVSPEYFEAKVSHFISYS